MLNNIKISFSRLNFIFNSNKFKAIFLMILFTCIFNLFNFQNEIKYEEALFSSLTNTLFIFTIIGIMFICSCITLNYFDIDYNIIIRFKNKFRYFKNLFISITLVNLIMYLLSVVGVVLFVTFKYYGYITFGNIPNYNIPFVIYNIFTIIKYFVIINLLSLIGVCLYKNFGKVFCYIYYLLILILYYTYPFSANIIGEFSINSLFFKYHLFPYQYANFYLEIVSAIIIICIYMLFLISIVYVTIKYNKIKIDE